MKSYCSVSVFCAKVFLNKLMYNIQFTCTCTSYTFHEFHELGVDIPEHLYVLMICFSQNMNVELQQVH